MEKSITMQEIAELAGVSIATVSRVINQNGRYSKETEEKVLKLIKENNYVISTSKSAAADKKTRTVGILVPDITNPHFANLVQKIQVQLFGIGYNSIICNTGEQKEMEGKFLLSLKNQNVCGFIMISSKRFHKSLCSVPTVYVDRPARDENEDFGVTIESDNITGGFLAGQQLAMAGCKTILVMRTYSADANQERRYQGFLNAMNRFGIEEDHIQILHLEDVSIETSYSAMSDYLMRRWNGEAEKPFDGVMTTTDSTAAGAYCALRDAGVRVPEDVKLTGFDDSDFAQICGPGITSIRQDVDQMAKLAVKNLVNQINGGPSVTNHYLLPVNVIVRASTTPAALLQDK